MESKVIVNDTYTTIELSGSIFDQAEGILLEGLLNEHKNSGIQSVIINLSQLENISAEGIQYLESFHNDFYNSGRSLVYTESSENVLKKIKQEQLHLIVKIYPTMEEAIEAINAELLERDLMNEN